MTGSCSSNPISDQVPLLRKAGVLAWLGTAATALAVSCPATVMTLVRLRPVALITSALSAPSVSPGSLMVLNSFFGSPSCSISA